MNRIFGRLKGPALLALCLSVVVVGGATAATLGAGYPTGRALIDAAGNFWTNGALFYDANGNDDSTAINNLRSSTNVDGNNAMHELRATYDFTIHGGAAGTFNLGVSNGAVATIQLPNNAVILDGLVDVVNSLDSTDNTAVNLTANTQGDILQVNAKRLYSGAEVDISPISRTTLKTTAARTLQMTLSGASLTKGKFVLFLRYFISG